MKKLDQWQAERANEELGKALRQLQNNVQAIFAHSRSNQDVRDLCFSLNKAVLAIEDAAENGSNVTVVVVEQFRLPEYELSDSAYGQVD